MKIMGKDYDNSIYREWSHLEREKAEMIIYELEN